MASVTPLRRPTARDMLAGIKVIDVDTHLSEPHDLWTSRASSNMKSVMPRVVGEGKDRRWVIGEDIYLASRSANSAVLRDGSKLQGVAFYEHETDTAHQGASEAQARVKLMDEQGIYAQITYPNVLGFSGQKAMRVEEALRCESVRIFNDAMADMQKESGDRIFPMALLPWWDIDKAVAEVERCLKLGLKGINISPDPHEHGLPTLGHKHWDKLWEVCTANDMPVNFHIGASDASTSWYSTSSWPDQTENQKVAMGGMILFISNLRVMANILMSRFLERHPTLKIVSVESGAGWVPYMLEALEYMSQESGLDYRTPPSEVFKRQIYACTFFERQNLVHTIRTVGADNIMFETDFPHPACIYPDSLEYMAPAIAEMTPEERFKVFSGNAARVYNIDIS